MIQQIDIRNQAAGIATAASSEQKTETAKRARKQAQKQARRQAAKNSQAARQIALVTRRPGRFPHASMGTIIWLTIVWVMLWGKLNTTNFVAGFILALFITTIAPFPFTRFDGRFRPWGVLRLSTIFFADIIRASFAQARFILSGKEPRGAIIRVQLRSHSDVYLAMVSGMTGLVPGSVVVDAHRATGMLYVHVFDMGLAGGPDGVHRSVLEQEERVLRAFASHDELVDAGYVPGSHPSLGRLPTPYAPATGPELMRYGVLEVPEVAAEKTKILEQIAGNRLQGQKTEVRNEHTDEVK